MWINDLDLIIAKQGKTFSAQYINTHEYTKLIKMHLFKDKIHLKYSYTPISKVSPKLQLEHSLLLGLPMTLSVSMKINA